MDNRSAYRIELERKGCRCRKGFSSIHVSRHLVPIRLSHSLCVTAPANNMLEPEIRARRDVPTQKVLRLCNTMRHYTVMREMCIGTFSNTAPCIHVSK